MSTGGKWVKTRVPSMPCHQKVWCGIRFVWFQEIFWVRKYRGPGRGDDLRERRRVAEGVGQPDLGAVDAELLEEEPLAGQELSGHRLAARHVGVRLDPHAADRDELSGSDFRAGSGRTAPGSAA